MNNDIQPEPATVSAVKKSRLEENLRILETARQQVLKNPETDLFVLISPSLDSYIPIWNFSSQASLIYCLESFKQYFLAQHTRVSPPTREVKDLSAKNGAVVEQ